MKANLTLFFLAIFLGATFAGWNWPYIAKLMPIYVAAVPGAILAAVQLYREATGWEEGRAAGGGIDMDEVYESKLDKQTEKRRTIFFFGWFIGGALGIWLLGIVIALPLLVFLYMAIEGREKWVPALVMTVCTYLLVWGVFEYTLEMKWPPGALFR
ncbi:MAG TPA: tripartite tricarboxylate transporter TctB family protein [Candidatus Eisenbacteria bacterium]|nr:tripartite tricarboxylate transporter TctB family protein [Candidatus Eisenbacteria bacterium]